MTSYYGLPAPCRGRGLLDHSVTSSAMCKAATTHPITHTVEASARPAQAPAPGPQAQPSMLPCLPMQSQEANSQPPNLGGREGSKHPNHTPAPSTLTLESGAEIETKSQS